MPLTERDINIPFQNSQSGVTTPSSLSKGASRNQSRLPVPLTTTPRSSSPHSKWSRTTADHAGSPLTGVSKVHPQVDGQVAITSPTPAHRGLKTPPSLNKPLPIEKPLPSKPVALLSTTPSPSKHGRSLIDAVEHPLQMTSITGAKHEWPSLKPQSVSPSTSTPSMDSPSQLQDDDAAYSTPASDAVEGSLTSYKREQNLGHSSDDSTSTTAFPRATDLDRAYSSSHSYVTANNARISSPSDSSSLSVKKTRSVNSSTSDLHVVTTNKPGSGAPGKRNSVDEFNSRQMSLRKRISEGDLMTRGSGASQKIIGFTDYTRSGASSPSLDQSRVHTPSPASFSQPRPNSAATPTMTPRMKTASRIPLPENKASKPTIVHVKDNKSPVTSTFGHLNESSIGPSYGSRRLDAPNALQILDQGVRRRQMQQNLPNGQRAQLRRAPTEESMQNATTTLTSSRSHTSSSNCTYDPYSLEENTLSTSVSEEEEDFTRKSLNSQSDLQDPTTRRYLPMSGSFDDSPRRIPSYYLGADNVSMRDTRPPPTSPYTAPLPTIHSQAALGEGPPSPEDQARVEVSSTLSQLEGRVSPPRHTSVDEGTLIRMFGRLKPNFSKAESSSLADNAAAAEKFLTMRDSDLQSKPAHSLGDIARDEEAWDLPNSQAAKRQTPMDTNHNLVSKWSCTTPSEHALSPASADLLSSSRRDDQMHSSGYLHSVPEDFVSAQKEQPSSESIPPHGIPPKPAALRNISSGTHSRIPVGTATPPSSSTANIPKRQSSPTLGGERPPGSVRKARETMQSGRGGYAKSTASADSRKALKFPRPSTKVPAIPENLRKSRHDPPREDTSSMIRNLSSSKLERSRSKGRHMLNRINGLFPGKRDKKPSATPLAPRIEESGVQSVDSTDKHVEQHYPPHGAVRVPTTPKLHGPSSPSIRPVLRRLSTSLVQIEGASLADSVGAAADASSVTEDPSHSLQTLSEHLVEKARHEVDVSRKERLLSFAKVLTDSLIAVREAHISAETAKQAAKNAQMSLEMTQRGLALLQKLAVSLNASCPSNGRC